MRRAGTVGVALLLLVSVAQAAPAVTEGTVKHNLTLTTQANVPIKLAAGKDGGTTISVNKTGAKSSVTGGVTAANFNTTFVNDTSATNYRVRLVFDSWSGGTADCFQCDLQLRRGGNTSSQIELRNGAVQKSVGPWESINATGTYGFSWNLWTVAQATALADVTATVKYHLEIGTPQNGTFNIQYWNMTMAFVV